MVLQRSCRRAAVLTARKYEEEKRPSRRPDARKKTPKEIWMLLLGAIRLEAFAPRPARSHY
jgi:hypothetical protein